MHDSSYNAAFALDRSAWARPSALSVVYGDQRWTVAQAAHLTRQLAQLLARSGVSKGDRVLFVAHNSPYHLFVYIACARLGAVFVPVSFRLAQNEVQEIVDFCSPRAIFADATVAARGSFASTGTFMSFVIDDDPADGSYGAGIANGYFALTPALASLDGTLVSDCRGSGSASFNTVEYPTGTAAIFYTSGSASGSLRAVELTHRNLWWAARNFREAFGYGVEDVIVVGASLAHIGGFNGGTLDLFVSGGAVVLMRSFDASEALRLVEQRQATIFFGVPTMFWAIVTEAERGSHDLSSLRLPVVGGAPVPLTLLDRLKGVGLKPAVAWGMTETAGSGTFQPYGSGAPGAVGRPYAHVEARIVDPATQTDATVGELLVRGPSISPGYWHNADQTRSAFVEGGWLRTGDVAVGGNEVTIVGRLSDRIGTGGEGVNPAEVEEVLRAHPKIDDVVVVGIPDEVWGEIVAAAIVCDAAAVPTLAELQAFAAQVLARYKLPRGLARIERVPLDAEGKVDRAAVKDRLVSAAPSFGQ